MAGHDGRTGRRNVDSVKLLSTKLTLPAFPTCAMTQRFPNYKLIGKAAMLSLLNLCCLFVSHYASAQSTDAAQFDVELIVFSVTRPAASVEDWAFEETLGPPLEDTADGIQRDAASNVAFQTFPALEASQLKMTAMVETLQRSSAYKIVAHFGWKQPGKGNDTAIPVSISGFTPQGSPISGTVTLVRSRFLHLKVNLAYVAADGHRYILREQRRIQRPGDKHYLDHPYFGVIATVNASN
jgi:hypothetical protein